MKGELISTALYAEGRPRDVGTDRALAANYNAIIDYTTSHQLPFLRERMGSKPLLTEWWLYSISPIFLGLDNPSTTISKSLRVAPWFCSTDGTTVSCRITLTDMFPTLAPSAVFTASVRFIGKYSMATWTTSSTTLAIRADADLTIVKNLNMGYSWLTVEFNDYRVVSRGIAKCVETARSVT